MPPRRHSRRGRPPGPAASLPEPFAAALAEALGPLTARADIVAVLLCGSAAHGRLRRDSDLDLLCVGRRPFRQRHLRLSRAGVPVEIFVNPPERLRRDMADERAQGAPAALAMLATGAVLVDRDPETLAALRREAAAGLRTGPAALSPGERVLRANQLRDLCDDSDGGPPAGAECLLAAVRLHYRLQGRWLPKMKDVPADLGAWDPVAADLLADPRALAAHVLAAAGGLALQAYDGPEEG